MQGIASQKDLFSGDPLQAVRRGPVFGTAPRHGTRKAHSTRVMRMPPEATRLPAVPEDTRLGGMGTESSMLSRDSSMNSASMNSASSRPRAWW